MHELSIMESALDVALRKAAEFGATRILAIHLRVGTLSGTVPEALQLAFEVLSPGTLAEGAQIAIESVPARFWCAGCGREFESPSMYAECPACHEASREIKAGRELEMASMEIE